jgi:hypothetical protein
MPSDSQWRERLAETLNASIERRDVWIGIQVRADPDFEYDQFDFNEFSEWVEDWIGFTIASTAGPVMPGTGETEWTVGDNEDVRIKLLLQKRADPEGPLVVDS